MSVTASTATASEVGSAAGWFTFRRTGDTSTSLTVRYTVGGTATADTDYAALPETVTIPAGSLAAALEVLPIDDSFAEGTESVVVSLDANESYAIGAPAGGIVTIASDDAPADLVVSTLTPPVVGGAGAAMTVKDVTGNQGAGVAESSETGLYLSASGSINAGGVAALRSAPLRGRHSPATSHEQVVDGRRRHVPGPPSTT